MLGAAGQQVRGGGVAGVHEVLGWQQVPIGEHGMDWHRHRRVGYSGVGGTTFGYQVRWVAGISGAIVCWVLSQVSLKWTLQPSRLRARFSL